MLFVSSDTDPAGALKNGCLAIPRAIVLFAIIAHSNVNRKPPSGATSFAWFALTAMMGLEGHSACLKLTGSSVLNHWIVI